MSDKIVGLRGRYVPTQGEVVESVVDLLESLLADAKAGRLHAIAMAADYVDDTGGGVRHAVCGQGIGFDMIGGLEMAKAAVIAKMGQP